MDILLIGGTGAIGGPLTTVLSNSDNNIYITTRKERKEFNNIHFIIGNAHDLNFLNSILLKKWDCIIDFMIYNTKEFAERINILLNSTKQYIYISSARVYANSKTLNENSPRLLETIDDEKYLKTDEYALSKARQENQIMTSGMNNWTIVRPYITYNQNRLQLGIFEKEDWLFRALNNKKIIFPRELLDKYTTLTNGNDVASTIYQLIGNTKAYNQIYNIVANNCITWKEVLDIYITEIKVKKGIDVKIQYVSSEDLKKIRKESNLYQYFYDRSYNRKFDTSKIQSFYDVNKYMSPEKGLKECIDLFLDESKFQWINWRDEALKDRISHEIYHFWRIGKVRHIIKYYLYRFFLQ